MPVIKKLFDQYFNKQSSPIEKKKSFEDLTENKEAFLNHFDEAEWNAFCEATKHQRQYPINTTKPRQSKMSKWVIAAATAAITITLIVLLSTHKKNKDIINTLATNNALIETVSAIENARLFILPDSSFVYLSPGSSIKYNNDYNLQKRDVYLNGEARFSVHRDTLRKFSVYCDSVVTTALGTEFVVSNKNKNLVEINLMHGKIAVTRSVDVDNDGEIYYLDAGDAITYDETKKMFIKTVGSNSFVGLSLYEDNNNGPLKNKSGIATVTSKTTGNIAVQQVMRFNDMQLSQVFEFLSHRYNTKIFYPTSEISKISFIGTIHPNESITSILTNITRMNNLTLGFDSAHNIFTIR